MSGKQPYLKLDNKYTVDFTKMLGSGGCGNVYFGWQQGGGDQFLAIKSIPINSKFEITDSMLKEINLLRKLDHPNIVKFIDAKKTKDQMYLIMEFCNEGDLEDLVTKQNVSENEVLVYFRQICQAFRVLHYNNILHGDVKPSNILLNNSQCKLADFGVSKAIDRNLQNTTLRGTPVYMAPQILNNQPYTTKSDIWSLGVTLFFLLFKTLPWNEKIRSHQQNLRNFIMNEYNPDKFFSQAHNSVSEFTLNLLKRMLVVEEEKRISWEELFDLVIGKEDSEEWFFKDKPQVDRFSMLNNSNNDIITRQSVDIRKQDGELDITNNQEADEDLQNNADLMYSKYYFKNEQILKAKEARNQLEIEIQKANFFEQVAKQIEEQRSIIEPLPGGLYSQCLFLLRKRCYIHYYNLQQMDTFTTNRNGNIEIDEELWDSFYKSNDWKQEVMRFQNIISVKVYEQKKLFTKSNEDMTEAYNSLSDFNQVHRGNAFNDQIFEENSHLILAFNDTMIKLFGMLAEQILEVKKKNIKLTKQSIEQETGINIHLVYDLICIISFRQFFKQDEQSIKLSQYNEEKRKCETEELLYRIEIAYNEWIIKKKYPQS